MSVFECRRNPNVEIYWTMHTAALQLKILSLWLSLLDGNEYHDHKSSRLLRTITGSKSFLSKSMSRSFLMNPHHSFFLLYMATMHINKLINGGEYRSLYLPLEDDNCEMSCSSIFMCRKISCRGCRRQASIAAKKTTRDHHPGRLGQESDVGVEEKRAFWFDSGVAELELEGLCSCSPKPPGKNLPAVRSNSISFRRRNTQNTRAMVIQKCELCCWSFLGRLPDIETAC